VSQPCSTTTTLREGIQPPPAERLITFPGAVNLSRGGLW
jgi:hypothetical protein